MRVWEADTSTVLSWPSREHADMCQKQQQARTAGRSPPADGTRSSLVTLDAVAGTASSSLAVQRTRRWSRQQRSAPTAKGLLRRVCCKPASTRRSRSGDLRPAATKFSAPTAAASLWPGDSTQWRIRPAWDAGSWNSECRRWPECRQRLKDFLRLCFEGRYMLSPRRSRHWSRADSTCRSGDADRRLRPRRRSFIETLAVFQPEGLTPLFRRASMER